MSVSTILILLIVIASLLFNLNLKIQNCADTGSEGLTQSGLGHSVIPKFITKIIIIIKSMYNHFSTTTPQLSFASLPIGCVHGYKWRRLVAGIVNHF
jgi:hypothetical protein